MARDYISVKSSLVVSYYISYRHIIIGTFNVSKYSFFNNIAYKGVYKLVCIIRINFAIPNYNIQWIHVLRFDKKSLL